MTAVVRKLAREQDEVAVEEENLYIRRIQILRAAYRSKRYYAVFNLSGTFSRYIEAPDRDAAKRHVVKHYPKAKFWR